MDFPKTLVLGIFTHGEQPLHNETMSPILTDVPSNMPIYKIDAVLPGVANVSTVENFERIGDSISNLINTRKINWDELTNDHAYDLAQQIAYKLITENDSMSSQIDKDYNYSVSKKNPIPSLAQYVHTSEHPMRILTYRPNEQMPDKLFTKILPGELLNPEEIPENYCGKIIMLNVEGQPDIFDIIEGFDDTPFSGLNAFFEAMEIQNLIVVDLSCNVFQNIKPDSRMSRLKRRQMLIEENSIKIPKNPIDDRTYRRKSRKVFATFPKKRGGTQMRKNKKHRKTRRKHRKTNRCYSKI